MAFNRVQVGDIVTRMLAGVVPMQLRVSAIDENTIECGDWLFDRATGMEIDYELGWGPQFGITGSFLIEVDCHEGAV